MRLMTVLACSLLLPGCLPLYVPMPHRASGTRHRIEPATFSQLEIGRSSIRDALLLLGEPDSGDDPGPLLYRWYAVDGTFMLISVVAVGFETGSRAEARLEFDEAGILRSRTIVNLPMKVEVAVMR